jgi:hypothetical protein
MKVILKKIHHLIRYFIVFATITFIGYIKQLNDDIFLFLIGPPLYIAHTLKSLISENIVSLPNTDVVNDFFFLLPVCLIYFGFIGFQLKQLWNERGKIRFVILLSFIIFIVYVHMSAAKALAIYLAPGPLI